MTDGKADAKVISLVYQLDIEIPVSMAGTEVAMKLEELFGLAAESVGRPTESTMLMVTGIDANFDSEREADAVKKILESGLDWDE